MTPFPSYIGPLPSCKGIFDANGKQEKAGVAILISDKVDLKIKNIIRDKEGLYIMIKGSILEEEKTIVHIYTPNIRSDQISRSVMSDSL